MLFLFRIGSKTVLIAISLVIFFSACSEPTDSELAVFRALDESLINSNATISKSTDDICGSLKEKLTNPITVDKARLWESKAAIVSKISSGIVKYIETLKKNLKSEVSLISKETGESFGEGDKGAVHTVSKENGKAKELIEKLNDYKKYPVSR